MRPRHPVHPVALMFLRPLFRFSSSRNAYVLRIGGRRRGPALVPKQPG